MDIEIRTFENRTDRYDFALRQTETILAAETDMTAGLANVSAALKLLIPDINWIGFYLIRGGELVLGPFQGKPAVGHIALGKGVCGTTAQRGEAQAVSDVHACCNHIACDIASASEIVLPIFNGAELFGLLDIDSPQRNNFTETDIPGLQVIADAIGRWIKKTGAK